MRGIHRYPSARYPSHKMKGRAVLLAVLSLLLTVPASADVVWPAVYVAIRNAAWYSIAIGLVVEYLFLWRGLQFAPWRALIADLVMNGASTLAGWFALPWLGWYYELAIGVWVDEHVLHAGTFNPFAWAITCLISILLSTALEALVLRSLFGHRFTKRTFSYLALANVASVAVAFMSLLISWPEV